MRVDGLQDLATITRQLREQRERAEAEEKARREAAARLEAERQLFSRAVGQVHPLTDRNLAELPTTPPEPLPLQHWLDEERVLMESISDDFDVSSLLDTDDQLSFRRPGIGVEITRRLRSGTGAFSASWTCTACAWTKRAKRWANSSATRTSWAYAVCA